METLAWGSKALWTKKSISNGPWPPQIPDRIGIPLPSPFSLRGWGRVYIEGVSCCSNCTWSWFRSSLILLISLTSSSSVIAIRRSKERANVTGSYITYIHMYIYKYIYLSAHVISLSLPLIYIYICVRTHICKYVGLSIYVYTYIYIYIHVYIHIYTYTYTYVYT